MSKAPKITSLQSLQYLRENVNDEVDFLPADELQRFLQIDAIILGVSCQTCPNLPKIASWQYVFKTISQKNKLGMKLIFCM